MEKEKYLPVECEVIDAETEGVMAMSGESPGGGGGSI